MAELIKEVNSNAAPLSLYEICLGCFVKQLNCKVSTLNCIQHLRFLPPEVLIQIYTLMSKRESLTDILFEQLADLGIFERLLRFEPARHDLFRCLASLVDRNKPLPQQLQQTYVQRYQSSIKTPLRRFHGLRKQFAQKEQLQDSVLEQSSHQLSNLSLASEPMKPSTSTSTFKSFLSNITRERTNSASKGNQSPLMNKKKMGVQTIESLENITDQEDEAEAEEDSPCSLNVLCFGMRLGSFLCEAGWFTESIEILKCAADRLRQRGNDLSIMLIRLDCLQRLLYAESSLFRFKAAKCTFQELLDLLNEIPNDKIPKPLLAITYRQFSHMHYARSEYDDSHMWSGKAMQNIDNDTPERVAIDVLRQAAQVCVVKREFYRANCLICQAVGRSRKIFGASHPKFADALSDYGFFLLNVDSVYQSVKVYQEALEIKTAMFGNRNFQVAVAHEDLSYAFYVHEYRPGNFTRAKAHVEKAVDIMKDLVPNDHLMLASAKRVKALILEELALDKISDGLDEAGLLKESEALHNSALQLSLEVFGEVNAQTAKHYGNLGRLYQTMNRFDEAERMHKKAIKIKTDLLGPFDYEVGLSIGHLASLYNYHMKKYREAEELYLRSIDISLRLFGRSYSGLEYDYLGLCHVYETLHNYEKYLEYANILENWQVLRGQYITLNRSIYPVIEEDSNLDYIREQYFNLANLNLTASN